MKTSFDLDEDLDIVLDDDLDIVSDEDAAQESPMGPIQQAKDADSVAGIRSQFGDINPTEAQLPQGWMSPDQREDQDRRDKYERDRALGIETTPILTQAGTAVRHGLERAATLPATVGSFLNTVTGFPHLMDALGVPSPSGGKSWVGDEQAYIDQMAKDEVKRAQLGELAYGEDAPIYGLVEGTTQGLAELPATMVGGGVMKGGKPLVNAALEAERLLGRQVVGSAVTSGLQSASRKQSELRAGGMNEFSALPISVLNGIIDSITTKAFGASGTESIFKKEGPKGLALKIVHALKEMGMEGAEESAVEIQQVLADNMSGENVDLDQAIHRTVNSFLVGAAVSGAAVGGKAVTDTIHERQHNENVRQYQEYLQRQQPRSSVFREGGLSVQQPAAQAAAVDHNAAPSQVDSSNTAYLTGDEQVEARALHKKSKSEALTDEEASKLQAAQKKNEQLAWIDQNKTPLTEDEENEAHELLEAQKSGPLTKGEESRLNKLRDKDRNGFSTEEQELLDEAQKGLGKSVNVVYGVNPEQHGGFSEAHARPNPVTGAIDINPSVVRHTLSQLKTKPEKLQFLKSLLDEESIHTNVSDEDAAKFHESATGLEKFLAQWRYTGSILGDKNMTKSQLGHEMLRLHLQRMAKMTPTEVAMQIKGGKLRNQALVATERAILKIRNVLNKASDTGDRYARIKSQLAILDKVQKNIQEGKAEADKFESEQPFSQPQGTSKAVQDYIKAYTDPDAKVSNTSDDKSVMTTAKTGLSLESTADLDAMLELQRDNAKFRAYTKEQKAKNQPLTPDEMKRYFKLAGTSAFAREVVEMATNTGSWGEHVPGGRNKQYGKRPLDYRNHPEVQEWIRQHGEEMGGITLPEEEQVFSKAQRKANDANAKLAMQVADRISEAETPEEGRALYDSAIEKIERFERDFMKLTENLGGISLDKGGHLKLDTADLFKMIPETRKYITDTFYNLKQARQVAEHNVTKFEAPDPERISRLEDDQVDKEISTLNEISRSRALDERQVEELAKLRAERDRRFDQAGTEELGSNEPFSKPQRLENGEHWLDKGGTFHRATSGHADFSHKKWLKENPEPKDKNSDEWKKWDEQELKVLGGPYEYMWNDGHVRIIYSDETIYAHGTLNNAQRRELMDQAIINGRKLVYIPSDEGMKNRTLYDPAYPELYSNPQRSLSVKGKQREWLQKQIDSEASDLNKNLESIYSKDGQDGVIDKFSDLIENISLISDDPETWKSLLEKHYDPALRSLMSYIGELESTSPEDSEKLITALDAIQQFSTEANDQMIRALPGEGEGTATFSRPHRGGIGKKAAELSELRRRIAEMKAKDAGEEVPEGLKSKPAEPASGSFKNPVSAEERVGPEAGGLSRPSPAQIEATAKEILESPITGQFKAKSSKRLEADLKRAEASESPIGAAGVKTGKMVYEGPSYEKFKNKVGWDISDERLFPIWEEAVWNHLMGSNAERLTELRSSLGLEGKLGKRQIMDLVTEEVEGVREKIAKKKMELSIDKMEKHASALEQQAKKASNKGEAEMGGLFAGSVMSAEDAASRAKAIRERASQLRWMMNRGASLKTDPAAIVREMEVGIPGLPQPRESTKRPVPGVTSGMASKKYRNTVISHIGRELLSQAEERHVEYDRDQVSIDDIDFSNEKTEFGAYTDISRDDANQRGTDGKPDVLTSIFRDQARGSSLDPESASRRAVAVVGKDGKVYLVSTFNDAGTQRITDPHGGTSTAKPNRELNNSFLNKWRPFASILLNEPVRGLHQEFDSVSHFMEYLGKEASNRASIGEYEAGEGRTEPEDFEVDVPDSGQGGVGIEGEGGSFMGPGKGLIAESSKRRNAMEAKGEPTHKDVERILTNVLKSTDEGDIEGAQTVLNYFDALEDRAKNRKMTAQDRLALASLNKVMKQYTQGSYGNLKDAKFTLAELIFDRSQEIQGKSAQAAKILSDIGGEEVNPQTESSALAPANLPTSMQTPKETPGHKFTAIKSAKPGEAPGITGKLGFGMPRPEMEHVSSQEETIKDYEMRKQWEQMYAEDLSKTREMVEKAKQIRERYWRKNKTLMPWETAWELAGGPKNQFGPYSLPQRMKKIPVGATLSRMVANFGSAYDEWLVDRIERHAGEVGKESAPMFRHMIDRAKELYGEQAIELDKARAAAGGTRPRQIIGQTPSRKALKASYWMHKLTPIEGAPDAAVANTVGAIEGTIQVPDYAQELVDLGRKSNLTAGRMYEKAVPGYQSSGDVVSNLTPMGIRILLGNQGVMWKNWVDAIQNENSTMTWADGQAAIKNINKKRDKGAISDLEAEKQIRSIKNSMGMSNRAANRALSKLRNDLLSARNSADRKAASEAFIAAVPNQALAFEHEGKTYTLVKNFQASGKFQRNITAMAYDVIRAGSGKMWERWTNGLAKANNLPVEEVEKFFREFKDTLDQGGVGQGDIERVNQDFVRKFPKVVTHVKHLGMWHPMLHADLFNYLENVAQRAAHIRAFREQFPATPEGAKELEAFKQVMTRKMDSRGVDALNALMKTLQGVPTDDYSSWGMFSPTETTGQIFRTLNSTIGNVMAKLALTGQMFVQPGELAAGATPQFLGFPNYLRALAKVKHIYGHMEQQGMVNKVLHDYSFDPNSPIRSSFRIAGNTISKAAGEQFFNEMQEALAAATARVVSERIKARTLDDWERSMLPSTFKIMGFNKEEIQGLMQGDDNLLGQFQRKAAAFLTSGNKSISEGSKLGANRLFNTIFRFQAYPMMKLNQFRRTMTNWIDAERGGTKFEKAAARKMMARFIGGSTVQGALTSALTSLAFSGLMGLKIKEREMLDEPVDFAIDQFMATVSGPIYAAWRGFRSKGIMGPTENAKRMIFPYTVASELSDFGTGSGRYRDKDVSGRIGEFIKAKIPGTRALSTGMALFGLSQKDKNLDASMDGFYRWRRDKQGFIQRESFLSDDNWSDFRKHMNNALEALKDGDEDAFIQAYTDAAAEMGEQKFNEVVSGKDPTKESVAESLRRHTVLRNAKGGKLTMDEMEDLRKHIGSEAVERLEWFDLMIEKAADGDLLPRYDD